jgi:hypothetical protein
MSSLKGKTVVVTGTLKSMGRAEAQRKLEAIGARVSKSVSNKTDILFAGRAVGSKYDQAEMRGIPILDESALLALLEGADIESLIQGEQEPAQEPPKDALEKFTSLDLQKPDPKTWEQITTLLDQCGVEVAAVAVDHLLGALAGWDGELVVDTYTRRRTTEVRVAPASWVSEILRGEEHPKLRLARVLDLGRLKLTGKVANHIFACPSLASVQLLKLDHEKKLPGTFYNKLCSEKLFSRLTHLSLSEAKLGKAHAAAFAGATTMGDVTHLGLGSTRFDAEASLETLLGSPAWASLQHVDYRYVRVDYETSACGFRALARNPAVKDLRSIAVWYVKLQPEDVDVFVANHAPHLERLSLSDVGLGGELVDALTSADLPRLSTLYLQGAAIGGRGAARLVQHLPSRTLEELTLANTQCNDSGVDALISAAPENLRELSLSNNKISDAALARLVAAPWMKNIVELNLAHTECGMLTARALCETPLPALERLIISKTKVTAKHIERICSAEALPALSTLACDHPLPKEAWDRVKPSW